MATKINAAAKGKNKGTNKGNVKDVGGRHTVWGTDAGTGASGYVWHYNGLHGVFLGTDGFYYAGFHYHPWGNAYGVPA